MSSTKSPSLVGAAPTMLPMSGASPKEKISIPVGLKMVTLPPPTTIVSLPYGS